MEEKFRNAVEAVLNNWSALQLAVEHGMGGPFGKQNAVLMVDEIVSMFCTQAKIQEEDVADMLSDTLDASFNTICEDDSPREVAIVLWEIFQHCVSNNDELLQVELNKLSTNRQWLTSLPVYGQGVQLPSVPENIGNYYGNKDNNSRISIESPMEGVSTNMEEGNSEQITNGDSEWTTVGSRRN